ncbi:hypothetical protein CFB82_40720 [Burkholderia sp. HI2714]|nr:hypothetical protein CFB82_40720 [Burkholderia sp. HI2714]
MIVMLLSLVGLDYIIRVLYVVIWIIFIFVQLRLCIRRALKFRPSDSDLRRATLAEIRLDKLRIGLHIVRKTSPQGANDLLVRGIAR